VLAAPLENIVIFEVNRMTAPSVLLNESATPFDAACMKVRHLEEAAVNTLIGRDWHKLSTKEEVLYNLLAEYGLIKSVGGFIRRI